MRVDVKIEFLQPSYPAVCSNIKVTLSAKSSLILAQNKAAFRREGHFDYREAAWLVQYFWLQSVEFECP